MPRCSVANTHIRTHVHTHTAHDQSTIHLEMSIFSTWGWATLGFYGRVIKLKKQSEHLLNIVHYLL